MISSAAGRDEVQDPAGNVAGRALILQKATFLFKPPPETGLGTAWRRLIMTMEIEFLHKIANALPAPFSSPSKPIIKLATTERPFH